MALSEFTSEQIAALGAAAAGILLAIANGWRSARALPDGTTPAHPGAAFLVLDAKQVALLIGEMGSLSASLAQLGAVMGRMGPEQEHVRRALERNTEAADNLSRRAEDLERAFTALTIETARGPGRR